MSKEIHSMDDIDPKYAKDYSEESFWDKITSVIKSAGLGLIYKALQLFYATQNPNCPLAVKAGIFAALGYFISPIDFIPDFLPGIGYADDAAAIGAALIMANLYIDENVKRQAREKIDDIFGKGTSDELVEDDSDSSQCATHQTAIASSRAIEAEVVMPSDETIDEIVAKMKKLKELLDAGIISQAEFDAKKDELMKRI